MLIVNLLSDRAAVTYGVSPVDMIWSGVPRKRLTRAIIDGFNITIIVKWLRIFSNCIQ